MQLLLGADSPTSTVTWPKQGMTRGGHAYELPTWAPPTVANDSSLLLPTPSAFESTPTQDYVDEIRRHLDDPHKRLYLPGRKWHAQRTLSRIAPALLPTPSATQNDGHDPEKFLARRERLKEKGYNGNGFGMTLGMSVQLLPTPSANDHTGGEGPTREKRQEQGRTGGSMLRDISHLLPTPTAGDSKASGSRNLPGSKAHKGVSLTDAVTTGNSETPRLLPTPQARDHKGRNQRDDTTCLPGAVDHLLPTPNVTSSRKSRKAMVENRQWSAPHIEQALEISQGILPREFKSWDEVPGWSGKNRSLSGAYTDPPSNDGKPRSDDSRPDQLTIEGV